MTTTTTKLNRKTKNYSKGDIKLANELVAVLESGIATTPITAQFNNEKLQTLTMRIHYLTQETKRNLFEIAVSLLAINSEKLYEAGGYKSVQEYAEKNFGYKKSMVYKLLNVADKFIEAREIDGQTVYMSKLAHENADYSVSQLMEINGVEYDIAKSLDENGVIQPEMTTKEIREVVKDFSNGEIDATGQQIKPAENDDSGENDENGENVEVVAMFDGDIASEFNAIIQHCENLISSNQLDEKAQKKIDTFKKFAMRCVVNYKTQAENENGAN